MLFLRLLRRLLLLLLRRLMVVVVHAAPQRAQNLGRLQLVLGRVAAVTAEVQAAVAPLLGPWGAGDAVVIEVTPEALVVDTDEAAGIVPRT